MDQIQSIPGNKDRSNQLPDCSTYDSLRPHEDSASWRSRPPIAHNLNPTRPHVSFAPAITRPEPLTSVPAGPLSNAEGGFHAATQGRQDSSDIATTSKLRREVFAERSRRVKSGGERQFTPQHCPFPVTNTQTYHSDSSSLPRASCHSFQKIPLRPLN